MQCPLRRHTLILRAAGMLPKLRIFRIAILRPLLGDPLRTGLTILAVSLGVAVVIAIELAGTAAAGSFGHRSRP